MNSKPILKTRLHNVFQIDILQHSQPQLIYRKEIDGLRAIAVLAVIFFHAGFKWFSGGFVGVDIFFVISGYLITSIILKEKQDNHFSIINFYERRIRRIIPALSFVLLVCLPFAWFLMLPEQLDEFGRALVSVTTFVSNIFFWYSTDYFSSAAEIKPLLHTWSLGVEEQYYIIFPLLMILCWKAGFKPILWLIIALALASFCFSEWASRYYETFNFFMILSRAWELFIGSLLAFAFFNSYSTIHLKIKNILSSIGLGLILFSIFLYTKSTPSPGVYMLAPTLGTALIIAFATHETYVAKLLSLKWVVGIGLISYSAYLWHQPLFAFARLYSLYEPTAMVFGLLSVLSIMLAYLTWRFIEKPFRNKKIISKKQIFIFALMVFMVFFGLGSVIHFYKGFKGYLNQLIEARYGDIKPIKSVILGDDSKPCSGRDPEEACHFLGKKNQPDWIIIGDSHAKVLSEPLWKMLKPKGYGLIDLTKTSCYYAPGLSILIDSGLPKAKCDVDFQEKRRQFLLSIKPSIILIHGRLQTYLMSPPMDPNAPKEHIFSEYPQKLTSEERDAFVMKNIQQSVQELINYGHTVILVYPVPDVGWHVPNQVYKLVLRHYSPAEIVEKTSLSEDFQKIRMEKAYKILDGIPSSPRLIRVYPEKVFCNKRQVGRCDTVTEHEILYADYNHLSQYGTAMLVDNIMDSYNRMKK